MKKMKKLLVVICAFMFCILSSMTSFASTSYPYIEEHNINPNMRAAYGNLAYPTWETFNLMIESLPNSYPEKSISIDSHFLTIGKTNSYENGDSKIWCYAWDSSITTLKISPDYNSSVDYVDIVGGNLTSWWWDYDTSSWIPNSGNIQTYEYVRIDGEIYASVDILKYGSSSVFYKAGITDVYLYQLKTDETLGYENDDTSWLGSVINWFKKIWQAIKDMSDSFDKLLVDLATSMADFFSELFTKLGEWFSALFEKLGEWFSTLFEKLGEWFSAIGEGVVDLGKSIADLFSGLWDNIVGFFKPDDDFMDNVMDQINEFNEQSSFISTIRTFVVELNDLLHSSHTTPPVINVNLAASEGKYNYGTKTVSAVDFSWFERYRVYTDPFLSAFFWGVFMWALAKRLPDILNGAGFVTESPVTFAEGAYTLKEKHNRSVEKHAQQNNNKGGSE